MKGALNIPAFLKPPNDLIRNPVKVSFPVPAPRRPGLLQ